MKCIENMFYLLFSAEAFIYLIACVLTSNSVYDSHPGLGDKGIYILTSFPGEIQRTAEFVWSRRCRKRCGAPPRQPNCFA